MIRYYQTILIRYLMIVDLMLKCRLLKTQIKKNFFFQFLHVGVREREEASRKTSVRIAAYFQ